MTQLTLITSVLDGMPYLEAMLASAPPTDDVEHLVIDAGSTDGTLTRLARAPHVRVIERPGISLYAAWNEGVYSAKGKYVAFLNADDEFAKGALKAILGATTGADAADMLSGDAEAFTDDGNGSEIIHKFRGEAHSGPEFSLLVFGAPAINARIFRRELVMNSGGFDESFTYAADRDFLLGLALRHSVITSDAIPVLTYRYRVHKGSMTLMQSASRRLETAQDHVRIADRYLALPDLDPEIEALLQAWKTHETAVVATRGLAAFRPDKAVSALVRLAKTGPDLMSDLRLAREMRQRFVRETGD